MHASNKVITVFSNHNHFELHTLGNANPLLSQEINPFSYPSCPWKLSWGSRSEWVIDCASTRSLFYWKIGFSSWRRHGRATGKFLSRNSKALSHTLDQTEFAAFPYVFNEFFLILARKQKRDSPLKSILFHFWSHKTLSWHHSNITSL